MIMYSLIFLSLLFSQPVLAKKKGNARLLVKADTVTKATPFVNALPNALAPLVATFNNLQEQNQQLQKQIDEFNTNK